MKQEIKERVERIRRGEVPEGYRKTKVGIIPADWDIIEIDKISEISTGNKDTKDKNNSGKYPFVVRSQKLENIDTYSFDGEAVLTAGDGVGVGKVYHYINGKFDYHQRVYNISNFNFIIKGNYFFEFFKCFFRKRVYRMSAKNSVDSVRLNMIAKMPISLPKKKEQEKIAEILSTWGKAIELKEKLIEEKKEFKRGLMNNMISAKMNDDSSWKFTKFNDIFKMIKRPIDKHPEEEYKRLTVKRRLGGVQLRDIKKGKEILVDSQHIVKEGDFIISKRQVFHGAIGVVQKKLENSIISMEYSILRCNEGFDTDFLFYCMYSPQFKKTIIKRTQGVHEEKFVFLFNEWYKTLGLHIPSIDEQKSTVSVLNNLNENIQILTNEVAQLKEQKRGLMQLLLTGIVRVEVN